ncbi:hypothetical protein SLE2022_196410 [Rubroshorea leprosula]
MWRWHRETSGIYTTKSAYAWLQKEDERSTFDFNRLWKTSAPSKVSAFCWQLIHDKIPSKDMLAKCRILSANTNLNCCWCNFSIETSNHLFVNCKLPYML